MLYLDVNLLFEERIAYHPTDDDMSKGEEEGGPIGVGDNGMNAIIQRLADAKSSEEDGHDFAKDIQEQWIDTKDKERCGPLFLSFYVDKEHEQSL